MDETAVSASEASDHRAVLVGREREQALLGTQLAAALSGVGSLVLVEGEAGIGKTTLIESLGLHARGKGALVLAGGCYDLSDTPPYGPWIELLDQLPADHDRARFPVPLGTGGTPASQTAMVTQVRDAILELASRHPLVLVLEDMHWTDPASLDLLRAIVRRIATRPLLVLATYRSTDLTQTHPLTQLLPVLARESRAVQIGLRRLDAEAVRAMVAMQYGLAPEDEARLGDYLGSRAEGNPLYIRELLRAAEDEGMLRLEDGGWTLRDIAATSVPALLGHIIDRRVQRLGTPAAHLLAIAAVIGPDVLLEVWANVANAKESDLFNAIEAAVAAGIMEDTGNGRAVRFAHAIIREAIYEGVPAFRHRETHRLVAEALIVKGSPDPEVVAYHFRQAGDAHAADWLVRAGENAQRAYAWLTAARHYEAALSIEGALRSDPGRRGWLLYQLARMRRLVAPEECLRTLREAATLAMECGDRALSSVVMVEQGWLHNFLGDVPHGLPQLEAGAAAAEELSPEERERLNRLDSLGNDTSAFNRHWGAVTLWRAGTGPLVEAVELGECFLGEVAKPSSGQTIPVATLEALGDGYDGLAIAYARLGQPAQARAAFAESQTAFRIIDDHFSLGANGEFLLKLVVLPYYSDRLEMRRQLAKDIESEFALAGAMGVTAPRLFTAALHVLEGRWAEAWAAAEEGSSSANLRSARKGAMRWLGAIARERGDPGFAWAQVRQVLPDGPSTPPNSCLLEEPDVIRLAVMLSLDEMDLSRARDWLECHDRWLAWSGAVLGKVEGLLGWSAYHRSAGDLDRARQHAMTAVSEAREPYQPLALLAAHRVSAEVDTQSGRYDEAAAHLRESFQLADTCAAPYERALTLLAMAELCAARGDAVEMETLLAQVRDMCESIDARLTLDRADALLARFSAGLPSVANPAGLTAREVEVLQLLVEGRTNREIAESLFISRRTVTSHVASIMGKLGVTTRAGAVGYALQHQLI